MWRTPSQTKVPAAANREREIAAGVVERWFETKQPVQSEVPTTSRLHLLVRSPDQLEAAIELRPDSITLEEVIAAPASDGGTLDDIAAGQTRAIASDLLAGFAAVAALAALASRMGIPFPDTTPIGG